MKRIILSFAILASISMTSFAASEISQQKRERKDFPKELKLSDEQKKQMEEINKDFDQKIEAVKKSRIVAEVQQERIKTLRDEKREAMGKILTAEQKELFEKKMPRRERAEKGQPRVEKKNHTTHDRNSRGHMRHGGFKMFDSLNLTDAQKEQMKTLREKFATEHKETTKMHKDEMMKILTPEQQKQLEENKAKFAEVGKNRKEAMQNMSKLDDASKAKLKDLRENYKKEKGAIEKSRIAPDMQKQKLQILKEKFEKDKQEILDLVK